MDVGTYLSGTSGTSLEINDLLEIEALFNLLTGLNYSLPEGVDEDTILDLYGYVSELAIMRKEDKISNLPKKAVYVHFGHEAFITGTFSPGDVFHHTWCWFNTYLEMRQFD